MRPLTKAQNAEALMLRNRDGGITAESVVEFARDPATALHQCFEWNNDAAAAAYRVAQAREVLRLVIEVVAENMPPIRAFVSLSSDRETKGGYRRLRDVLSDPLQRAVLLQDAIAAIRLVEAKYQRLEELAAVWHATDEVAGVMAWQASQTTKPGPRKRRRKAA